ncbi:MAG: metallopeptidase TldD-related protein, partial [Pseudomonadota bacterium]
MHQATQTSTQMLNTLSWEKLFKFPQSPPPLSFEFYADSTFQRVFTFEPKTSRLRSYETGGAQLIVQESAGPKTYHSTLLDPKGFAELVRNHRMTEFPLVFNRDAEPATKSWDRAREIEQTCRRMLLDLGTLIDFKAKYEETAKRFIFSNSDSGPQEGLENLACFTVEFTAQKGDRTRRFKIQRGRTDLESLSSDLEKTFLNREQLEKALHQPWPAPHGQVNVLWSASSVAKILLHFLYQLELLSRNSDFLKQYKKNFPQLSFQLIDNWKQGNRIDVEGRPRRETLLVDGGHLLGLLNEEVPGFSRRASARDFPITAPWEPALFGKERDSQIRAHLGNGISVHELDILSFQPNTGLISLQINEAALVHQGIEGEYIEPVTLDISLTDLLTSFKLFSDNTTPHPLTWSRSGQQLFVEVTTPEALSPALTFPGTVPLAH